MLKLAALILVALHLHVGEGQLTIEEPNVLTPPYFNIATGKRIEATATCGEIEPHVFCKLTGGPNEFGYNENLYQGQFCDVCDMNDPTKSHPIKYAIDGTEKWWQSPPLSQGSEFNKINLTIHLGQVFHVAYAIIKFANSPRAGTWVLERSSDHGKTFQPWQYFANSDSDCHNLFGIDAFEEITNDNSVICTSQYSDVVPLERGEVIVSIINNRPGGRNFSHSPVLQEWSKATDVRLRLLRTKTLLGHLMAVQRQDPTVTRRYFYSIKDISIGGRCVCNGHADTCLPDPLDKYKLKCECRHNTCGDSCELCCPGFVQKAWRAAVPENANECEPCNCHGHSTQCVYDEQVAIRRQSLDLSGDYEGGGVCQNCAHNTAGINCEICIDGYYRPANVDPRDPNGCRPCDCDSSFTVGTCEPVTGRCYCKPKYAGDRCDRCAPGYHMFPECEPCPCYYNATRDGICLPVDGVCPCKYNFAGKFCSECAPGFYNFPECAPCTCTGQGAISEICDAYDGQCECEEGFGGLYCDQCSSGYYRYPVCQACSCYNAFTTADVCDPDTGKCFCTELVTGDSCNQCIPGYYDFPDCKECQCTSPGSASTLCDQETGKCQCKPNYQGPTCDECAPEYYNYPSCIPCDCDVQGSQRTTCDAETGQCTCFRYIAGRRCDQCEPDYFNFPRCEDCKCNPLGIKSIVPGVCLAFTTGQCDCKDNVVGKFCDMCAPLHHNLTLGCVACNCFLQGTLDGVAACDSEQGECWCKPYTCSQKCSQCESGFYGLKERNYFGCSGCQCNAGGSLSQECETVDGQCVCKEGVTGRKCDAVAEGYYYPTLLQHKFEVEDGTTSDNEILRFGFSEERFPAFSMKGYGEFSIVQPKAVIDLTITQSSVYKVLIYYVNPRTWTLSSTVTFIPKNGSRFGDTEDPCPSCSEQAFQVQFEPSSVPALLTAKTSLVLNRGEWHVVVEGDPGLLIDYIVLLPSEYYEPGILQARVTEPCKPTLEITGKECMMYDHPSLNGMAHAVMTDFAESEQHDSPTTAHPTMVFLDGNSVNDDHKSVEVTLEGVSSAGKYVLVLEYASTEDRKQTLKATVSDGAGREYTGVKFNIYTCEYSFLCRQVALTPISDVMVFDVSVPTIKVDLSVDSGETVYVKGIHAIPYEQWTLEYVEPRSRCITKEGPEFDECIGWVYPIPATARVFDAGEDEDDPKLPTATDDDADGNYIGEDDDILTIDMDLEPGRYVFLLHYYNPNHLSFMPAVVITDGLDHEGAANVTYCPSGDGCRAVFTTDLGAVVIDITDPKQTMTITVPAGQSFWLDYVLAIPEESYNAGHLDLKPIDHSRRFFDECYGVGSEGLVETAREPTEFCRTAIFSLTTDFNEGALPCECSGPGTVGGGDVDCEDYGGQCPCKPNVIGRKCDKCKTGYFGWPDCQPCDCDGALCDEVNGNCICPPNTVTPGCDQCQPFTHSFHPLAGCVACDCHPKGVEDAADLGCSKEDGQCRCKENVEGIKCDRCKPGFFGFPDCRPCVCDQRGRISEGCDPVSGQCLCKENVEGQQCDRCRPGTFHLDENNPLGCTSCFCFGATGDCSSTQYPIKEIVDMDGWRLLNLRTDSPEYIREGDTVIVDVDENGGSVDPTRANLYWAAPRSYLGDLIGSYGGTLRFIVDSETRFVDAGGRGDSSAGESSSAAPLTAPSPTVILEGNGMVIGWTDRERRGYPSEVSLKLVETDFVHQATGNPVSREEMMMVLGPLNKLRIHASDDPSAVSVSLSGVSMTTTDYEGVRGSGETIPTVEECECPKGYTGNSCQLCDLGHYREQRGRFLGFCAECDCYGHCDYCGDSGELLDPRDCKHHTVGDKCEKCEDGYIGDATSGDPDACQPCPCPYPSEEGNFATKCEYDSDGEVVCHCEVGYTGEKCDQCSTGYFGNPFVFGGDCKACNCHGNLDNNLVMEVCDPVTGQCYDCQYSTGGKYCERCADGYFGDAIIAKNCTKCPCDECGTLQCDHTYGYCACKAHVIGIRCDQCEPGYWNLDTCNGCETCDCGVGAINDECDTSSGKCQCAPNVIGRKCDRCAPGHWDYSSMGCKPCNCRNNGDCNPVNGECKCPPGITGKQCDQCKLERHVLPPGGLECESCDTCTIDLLDTIEPETTRVKDATETLGEISIGLEAAKRLEHLVDRSDQATVELDKAKKQMDKTDAEADRLLNAETDSLNEILRGSGDEEDEEEASGVIPAPIVNTFEETEPDTFISLKIDLARTENLVSTTCTKSQALLEDTQNTHERMVNLDANATLTDSEIEEFNSEATKFLEEMPGMYMDEGSGNSELNVETTEDSEEYLKKLANAEMLIHRMKMRVFKPMKDVADEELVEAVEIFDLVSVDFMIPADDLEQSVKNVSQNLSDKLAKMKEMRKRLNDATDAVTDVSALNAENRKALSAARDAVNNILIEWETINNIIRDSQNLVGGDSPSSLLVLDTEELNNVVQELQIVYDQYVIGLEGMAELVNRSIEHALSLQTDANEMQRIVDETRNDPRNIRAVEAANRYQDIINTMQKAREAADKADLDATEAKNDVEKRNLDEDAKVAETKAGALLTEVTRIKEENIAGAESDLANARDSSVGLTARVSEVSIRLEDINGRIDRLNPDQFNDKIAQVNKVVGESNALSDEVTKAAQKMKMTVEGAPDADFSFSDGLRDVQDILSTLGEDIENVKATAEDLEDRSMRIMSLAGDFGLDEKIALIRKKIEMSRSVADSVKVNMKFKKRTLTEGAIFPQYTQVHVPRQSFDLTSPLELELSANVSKSADNSLLFLGDTSTADGDYVALETIDGHVYYYYKVGANVGEIRSDVPINDEEWHRIVIRRDENEAVLTVYYLTADTGRGDGGFRTETFNTKRNTLVGDSIGQPMPMETTPLIIGGMPLNPRPEYLKNDQLEGCVKGVHVNNERVGLWNFVSYNGPQPGLACQSKTTDGADDRWWKFRGLDSYFRVSEEQLIKDGLYNDGFPTDVLFFTFQTKQKDALIFFAGQDLSNFLAVEFRSGKIHLTYNFGWDVPRHEVGQSAIEDFSEYNGQVQARFGFYRRTIFLVINQDRNPALSTQISDSNADFKGSIWFGGMHRYDLKSMFKQYVPNIDVHYRGCIKDVKFHHRTPYNIYDATERVGVTPGCSWASVPYRPSTNITYISINDHYPNVNITDTQKYVEPDEPVIPPIITPDEEVEEMTPEPTFISETVNPPDYEDEDEEEARLVFLGKNDVVDLSDPADPDVMGKSDMMPTIETPEDDDSSLEVPDGHDTPNIDGEPDALDKTETIEIIRVDGDSTDGGIEEMEIDIQDGKDKVDVEIKEEVVVDDDVESMDPKLEEPPVVNVAANNTKPIVEEDAEDLVDYTDEEAEQGAQVGNKNVGILEEEESSAASVLPAILIIMGVIIGVVLIAAVVSALVKSSLFGGGAGSAPAPPPGIPAEQAPLNDVQAQRVAQMDW